MNTTSPSQESHKQKVGFLLGVGILFLPIVFAWFLLKPGYSLLARIVSFGWLSVGVLSFLGSFQNVPVINQSQTATSSISSLKSEVTAEKNATTDASTSKWLYDESVDKMRGSTSKYAILSSENELNFDFPYKGGRAMLYLRKSPKFGTDAYIKVDGQFMCNSYSNTTVSVKFDDKPIQRISCSDASDGSSDTMFITNGTKFISNLKTSKRIIIEAEFFHAGLHQMEFDTQGLDWQQ